jgi:hypothetical protein
MKRVMFSEVVVTSVVALIGGGWGLRRLAGARGEEDSHV